jgi:hypothetical protein
MEKPILRSFKVMRTGILSNDGRRLILKRYGEKDLILFTQDVTLLCSGFYRHIRVYERERNP